MKKSLLFLSFILIYGFQNLNADNKKEIEDKILSFKEHFNNPITAKYDNLKLEWKNLISSLEDFIRESKSDILPGTFQEIKTSLEPILNKLFESNKLAQQLNKESKKLNLEITAWDTLNLDDFSKLLNEVNLGAIQKTRDNINKFGAINLPAKRAARDLINKFTDVYVKFILPKLKEAYDYTLKNRLVEFSKKFLAPFQNVINRPEEISKKDIYQSQLQMWNRIIYILNIYIKDETDKKHLGNLKQIGVFLLTSINDLQVIEWNNVKVSQIKASFKNYETELSNLYKDLLGKDLGMESEGPSKWNEKTKKEFLEESKKIESEEMQKKIVSQPYTFALPDNKSVNQLLISKTINSLHSIIIAALQSGKFKELQKSQSVGDMFSSLENVKSKSTGYWQELSSFNLKNAFKLKELATNKISKELEGASKIFQATISRIPESKLSEIVARLEKTNKEIVKLIQDSIDLGPEELRTKFNNIAVQINKKIELLEAEIKNIQEDAQYNKNKELLDYLISWIKDTNLKLNKVTKQIGGEQSPSSKQ